MKTILVTGASGFIGQYVVGHLLEKGHRVIASARDAEKAAQAAWFPRVTFRPYDLHRPQTGNLWEYFERPDCLIHLAWGGLPNYKDLFHFETELPAQYAFLKSMIESGLPDLTVAGTCFEYGFQSGPLSETLLPQPANPYGMAKDTLRKFLEFLQVKQSFTLKWMRLFYLYGEGQNEKSLFSQLEKAIRNGNEVFNMSGGEQLRDFLPISTAADYLVQTALQNRIAGVVNCCSGRPISVRKLVEEHIRQQQANIRLNLGHYPYPDYEPMAFWGDNRKLNSIISNP